jgi:hypothetical protein
MFRGSRLAASFVLVLTGLVATAAAVFVLPEAVSHGIEWPVVPRAIAAATSPFAAPVGGGRGRGWGRDLAGLIAELGGGLAILGGDAILTGARPFGRDAATGIGLVAWTATMYALLGIAAGRVPVLAHLTPIERRRVVLGPSFGGLVPTPGVAR